MTLKEALDLIDDDVINTKGIQLYNEGYFVGRQMMTYYKIKILIRLKKVSKWIKKKQPN